MPVLKSRGWVFTLNNYTAEDEEYLQNVLDSDYLVYGRETSSTGTPHLQGYLYFKNPRSGKTVGKYRKWHTEPAKADALANGAYCKKGDNWFEKGTRPATSQEKGDSERDRYKRAYAAAVQGELDTIDPDILLRHYSTLKRLRGELYVPKDMDVLPLCIYLWGNTGVGKSRLAKELCGEKVYRKEPTTRWWTGFNHEENVWVDEMEPLDGAGQAMWKCVCDHYVCAVETKGGNINIRPKMIVFTSNHSPHIVFGPAYEPMARRLKIFQLTIENASQIKEDCLSLAQGHGPEAGSPLTPSS